MKKLHLAITLALSVMTLPALANDKVETCQHYEEFATELMGARQDGISLKKAVEIAEGSKLAMELVIMAYKRPKYSTDKYKQDAIKDFADEIYLLCLTAK